VAADAGVGGAYLHAEIRAGDPKTVIRAVIYAHVMPARHVTLDTLSPGADVEQHLALSGSDGLPFFAFLLVKMMCLGIVLMGSVALQTQIVALFYWFDTVDVVAVAAAHITIIHFTLGEGAINIYFIKDLSIRKI
jgi:hypothetical protein